MTHLIAVAVYFDPEAQPAVALALGEVQPRAESGPREVEDAGAGKVSGTERWVADSLGPGTRRLAQCDDWIWPHQARDQHKRTPTAQGLN